MKPVLIVFAQKGEAEGALKRFKAEHVAGEMTHVWAEGHIPSFYQFDKGWIAISNVGLHAAQMCVAKFAGVCDEVWNFGFAGALSDRYPLGELLEIGTVGKYVPVEKLDERSRECVEFTIPNLTSQGFAGRLVSSDFPIHDGAHRERLGKHWDLVDMEGYGVAFASSHLGKKWKLWKIVSDFASPGGRELIRKHRHELSEKIADTIEGLLCEQP